MTPTDILRVITFLEAAWEDDQCAMEALGTAVAGEEPIAVLVAAYADELIMTMVTTLAGVQGGQDDDQADAAVQRMRADPATRISALLADAFTAWSPSADLDGARHIARALISFVLAMTPGSTQDDVPPLLQAMRITAAVRTL